MSMHSQTVQRETRSRIPVWVAESPIRYFFFDDAVIGEGGTNGGFVPLS